MEILYEKDKDFKEYVDKYTRCRGVTVKTALTHKIVKEYGNYIKRIKKDGNNQL